MSESSEELRRIAIALEEILRLVKEDQERARGLRSLQDIADEKDDE